MSGDKPRILVVDDMPSNIRLVCEALQGDYELVVAINGERALELAESQPPPDLVLLDVVMPGMDGHDVCRRLKANPETQGIPVIFLTAQDQEEDETLGLELGAVDYITKPCSLPIVKVRVKTHLELKRQRDMLAELALFDALTRLPNRLRFNERLDMEWQRGQRQQSPLAVIFADIDYFKGYNDTYGHAKGDDCLRLVADELQKVLKRPTDIVARYGGEEFVALLPETDLGGGRLVAEAMRSGIEGLVVEHKASPGKRVTISMGIAATVPNGGDSPQSLLEAADKALYAAKEGGRNRVVAAE